MRAHYKRSKHFISDAWLRLWLSPVFEDIPCAAPPGEDPKTWEEPWMSPKDSDQAWEAMTICRTECTALAECSQLVDLAPDKPNGVVQAGRAFGIRMSKTRSRALSLSQDTRSES